MNNTLDWIDSFSKEQKKVLQYVLTKADCFIKDVSCDDDDIDSVKRTAFFAGFYLGLAYKGGELPPEPPEDV